jgi:hypothetical protein
MASELPDLWTTRDNPILRHVAWLLEVQEEDWVDAWTVERTSDFTAKDAGRALMRLYRGGYVDGEPQAGLADDNVLIVRLTEKGLREVGIWPDPTEKAQAFIDALEKAAEQESDPEQKGRLRQLAKSARSVSEGVLGSVIAAVITKAGGI